MTDRPSRRARLVRSLRLIGLAIGLYLRAAPVAVAVRVLAVVVSGLGPVAIAWFTKAMIDGLTTRRGSVVGPAVATAATGGAMALIQHLAGFADRELNRRVAVLTTARLFAAVNREVGIAELEDPTYHDRLRLAQQVAQTGPQQLTQAGLSIVQSGITVAGFLAALIAVSPLSAGVVLLSSVPILIAQIHLARRRAHNQLEITPRIRRQVFYSLLMLDLRAAKEIRLFGLGGLLQRRMLDEQRAAQAGERAVDRVVLRVDSAGSLLTAAVSAAALITMVVRIAGGHGTVGDLSILIGALNGIQGSLAGIIAQISTASQVFLLFGHFRDLTAAPVPPPGGTGRPAPPLRHAIVVRDVWFRYQPDQPWVLEGLDLTIAAGTSLALVGLNGAGKSTVVKLLCRMYEPTRGSITWDGIDLADLDPTSLRGRIGVLFQDFMMYEMSAAENIAVGDVAVLSRPEADSEHRIRESAELAGLHEALTALPDGYRTMLSRIFAAPLIGKGRPRAKDLTGSGVLLSGGQWQRLALARAVLRREADLLILDEPSSGLDATAEHDIHARLSRLRAGRTSLLISHRLSAIRDADLIVVIEGGRAVESGDHDALMRRSGSYATLFLTQARGYQLDPPPPAPGPVE